MAELSVAAYWETPLITRTLSTIMFVGSFTGYYWIMPLGRFTYWPYYLTHKMPPQVWRLLTCFLITGPKLAILFDTYFLYVYLRYLEEHHVRLSSRRADLAWFLLVICGIIMAIAHATGFIFGTMTEALIAAICYTATQEQRGGRSQYIFFSIPTQLMPYVMLLSSFLLHDTLDVFKKELIGIVAAHLYLFLTRIWPELGGGRNIISTPSIMFTLVGRKAGEPRHGGVTMRAQDPALPNMGPLPDAWANRGRGHRLG